MKLSRKMGMRIAHFLGIRKSASTAFRYALGDYCQTESHAIFFRVHRVRLADIPSGEKVFFVLRDPAERFVSGFNSRQRKGAPAYFIDWSKDEELVFSRFSSANELAEAISDPKRSGEVDHAFSSIKHLAHGLDYWLESIEYLQSRLDDIILVANADSLENDFERLRTKLNLPKDAQLPANAKDAHRSPVTDNKKLSAVARANLSKRYATDYEFIDFLNSVDW